MKSRHQIMRARTYEDLGHFEQNSINGAVIATRWEVKSEFVLIRPAPDFNPRLTILMAISNELLG